MWKNAPVTVLEKVYVSVTLLETLHLRFLHCPEHIYRSEEYNLALTKQLLILHALRDENIDPGENTALVSLFMYKYLHCL